MHVTFSPDILSCESRHIESFRSDREFLQISFWDISFERCWLWNALSVLHFCRAEALRSSSRFEKAFQSSLVKIMDGFTFFQKKSTKVTDPSLIPMKMAFRTLHLWNCFTELEQLYIAHVTNYHFWFFTKWVVSVVLLQFGLKCSSMKMTLDLHEFANTKVFCFFSQLHVAIQILWNRCPCTLFQHDLRLRFRLRLCLDLNVGQTLAHNWKTRKPVLSYVL